MTRIARQASLSALALCAAAPAFPQSGTAVPSESPGARSSAYPYVAGLVDAAPLVIDGTVRSADRLHGKDALGAPAGTTRMFVTMDVGALIRGTAAVPARLSFVWLAPLDAKGRLPRLRKSRVVAFARPVAGSADQVQLVRADALRGWTPALDQLARGIVKEAVASNAPPTITGIGHAFHAPGTLPGEGTTQVFLQTSDHRPISLTVERAASGSRQWSVALGDIVGAGAPPPARDTLLWFRLACALPRQLPAAATSDAGPDDATAAAADYAFVVDQLGACSTERPGA